MSLISRQLTVNIVTSNVWTQLLEGAGGTAYAVPSGGSNPRMDIKMLRAINLSSGSAAVEIGFSSGSPPSSAAMVWNKTTIGGEGEATDDSVHVLRAGEKIWARVSSTLSINCTVRASGLEVS